MVASDDENLAELLAKTYRQNGSTIETAVSALNKRYEQANKDVFYPLVVKLFRLLGYRCDVSRPGVNYQRWDAFIEDQRESIPVEINRR